MTGKTLVVHSGNYKTGSSAIQVYLNHAAKAGALGDAAYPMTGRSMGMQHINLMAELRNGPVFTPRLGSWDDLLAEMLRGDESTTIVSTENFSMLGEDEIAVIGAKCRARGIKVRWVHYLRDQPSFYNAFYVERIVNMRPEFLDVINLPFEDFGTWSPISLDLLDYGEFVEKIVRAIPDVDLILRPFSRKHLVGGDVISDFCTAVGVPYVPDLTVSTNVGTGWKTVETARRLTPLVQKARLGKQVMRVENPSAARMRWVALVRSALTRASEELGWNDRSAIYLTPEFRDVLIERYREENARVSELAGFDWSSIVEDEPVKPYNVGDFADIPGDEVMQVVDRVMSVALVKPDEIANLPLRQDPPATARSRMRRLAGRVRRRIRAR